MEKLNGLHTDHLLKKEMSWYVKDKTLLVNAHVFEEVYACIKEVGMSFIWGTLYRLSYCTVNANAKHTVTVEGI